MILKPFEILTFRNTAQIFNLLSRKNKPSTIVRVRLSLICDGFLAFKHNKNCFTQSKTSCVILIVYSVYTEQQAEKIPIFFQRKIYNKIRHNSLILFFKKHFTTINMLSLFFQTHQDV